jgi:hypothetical protein
MAKLFYRTLRSHSPCLTPKLMREDLGTLPPETLQQSGDMRALACVFLDGCIIQCEARGSFYWGVLEENTWKGGNIRWD